MSQTTHRSPKMGIRRPLRPQTGLCLVMFGAVLAAAPGVAIAQNVALEEIVVTSQKRTERLQDVSLAVNVMSGDLLKDMKVDRIEDIRLPGLHFSEGGNANPQFIRGIGSGLSVAFEQSVAMYSDGVWLALTQSQRLAFLDIERIEVLKGPQPTYLGKNAIAGALSFISKRPTREFEAGIDALYEFEANELATTAYVSGPLSDKMAARLAGRFSTMDGYMTNVATGEKLPERKDVALRGGLLFEPSSDLSIYVKGEYLKNREFGRPIQLINCTPGGFFDPLVEDCTLNKTRAVLFNRAVFDPPNDPFFVDKPGPDFREIEYKGGGLEANWDVNGYTVTALMAYYDQSFFSWAKNDYSTRQRVSNQSWTDLEFFSGEARVTSPVGGFIEWLAGVYYDTSDLFDRTRIVVPAASLGQDAVVTQDSDSWSIFGEIAVNVTDQLKIKVGGRYTDVKKNGTGRIEAYTVTPLVNNFVSATDVTGLRFRDDSFDPAVTMEWRPTEDHMFYVSWRKGFKSGGLDLDLAAPTPETAFFDSESVTYYEAGLKSSFNRVATINVAVFRGDYKNLQASIFQPDFGLSLIKNAGKVRTQGIEVEGMWAATEGLRFNAAAAYIDAKYLDFTGVSCYNHPPQTLAQGCVTVAPGVRIQDLTGARPAYAPKFSGTVGASVRQPLGFEMFGKSVDFMGRADVFFTSKYGINFNNDPDAVQSGFEKIDARIGLGADDGAWEIALVGRNLTDKITAGFLGDQPRAGMNSAHFAITERPREIMLQLRVNIN